MRLGHKYKAKQTEVNGYKFASKHEARYYQELCLLKDAGEVIEIELQPRFELIPDFYHNGKKVRGITYIADFKVSYKDRVEIIDCKGFKTPVYKLKKKLFQWKYPDKEIIEK